MTHPSAADRAERTMALVAAAKLANPGRRFRRTDGGKLEIIQRRLELIVGIDFDVEDEVDEDLVEGEVEVLEEEEILEEDE